MLVAQHEEIKKIISKRRAKAFSHNTGDMFNSTFDSRLSTNMLSSKLDNINHPWDEIMKGSPNQRQFLSNMFKSPLSIRADFTKIK
jgi:hypothetical protein